ncbi:WhiB family transcriptional regulator [Streptomyces parvulus]|uniref:WhiB family transcriptional regulator n=1 Tax=Streptomyces parvulus TaxID=146923 RepID=UPI0038275BD9
MRSRFSAPEWLPRPPHWDDDAACRTSTDPDIWFAEGDGPAAIDRREAKRVCRRCPAIASCLHAALERREPFGVWGGLDQDERAQLTVIRPAREPARDQEAAGGPPQEHAATA